MANANETQKRIPALSVALVAIVDGAKKPAESIEQAAGIQLAFSDGKGGRFVALGELSDSIQHACAVHGLKQKLVDAAAISRDPETGRSATIDDKRAAVLSVLDRLLSGEWNAQRGDGTGSGGLLFKALCRFYPAKTAEDIRAWLEKRSDKEKAALRLNPKIAAIIEQVRAEQAKADDVDSDGLLSELE